MPIFEFQCQNCGHIQEILCKFQELEAQERFLKCEYCGGSNFKQIWSSFENHFKYTRGDE